MRYVVEKVAKQPAMRRLKDTERGRYVKQPHGAEFWPADVAQAKASELNAAAKIDTLFAKVQSLT